MEECNDGALEFNTLSSIVGGGAECLPYDVLAGAGCNEERNARSQAVSLLKDLIEEDDDNAGNEQLKDEEQAYSGTQVGRISIEAADYLNNGKAQCHYESKELLSAVE